MKKKSMGLDILKTMVRRRLRVLKRDTQPASYSLSVLVFIFITSFYFCCPMISVYFLLFLSDICDIPPFRVLGNSFWLTCSGMMRVTAPVLYPRLPVLRTEVLRYSSVLHSRQYVLGWVFRCGFLLCVIAP